MNRFSVSSLVLIAAAACVTGGCATDARQARVDQPLPSHLQLAMNSPQPTFGVGDELGWLAFGDLALAPQPGEPTEVLVIARAETTKGGAFGEVSPLGFDWVGQYLAAID